MYTCPSSPGLNVRLEQKPSEELMSNVRPSLDLGDGSAYSERSITKLKYQVRSVNVAKCKLLTTTIGVICCVSYTSTASCVATA